MGLSEKFAITQQVNLRRYWALIEIRLQAMVKMFIKFVIQPSAFPYHCHKVTMEEMGSS